MNIVMATNTYLPHMSGVANSVHIFAEAYRAMGHAVTVIAPEFENMPDHETDVIRVPAIQNFNGSDFSISMAVTAVLMRKVRKRRPDIVHSHHPFLMGDTALRIAASLGSPLIYTYHTRYEYYTHYVPAESKALSRFVRQLVVEYCNLCDHIIAPSESMRDVLRERGVETAITVVPTGIDPDRFESGDGDAFRKRHGVPGDAVLAGYVGRLAPEKNCAFLAGALAGFIRGNPEQRRAVIVGKGPSETDMRRIFEDAGLSGRVLFTGQLTGDDLAGAYRAMDLFAFASRTETQGMVLAEAMAAGVPAVALDAPGTRDIVRNEVNGRLVSLEDRAAFVGALEELAGRTEKDREVLRTEAQRTARSVSTDLCAARCLEIYESALADQPAPRELTPWNTLRNRLKQEWEIWSGRMSALETALSDKKEPPPTP